VAGTLRIGTLGAARITPSALLRPARAVPGVEVVAVAARDAERAARFAARHDIPRVLPSYEALVSAPDVDAVYNPLPNSLHCEWTLRALQAGKHVLCEKPLAANAEEALRMAEEAQRRGRVLAEAFHWRYHRLAARMRQVIDGGEIGRVRRIEVTTCIPLVIPGDIRYRLDLAGGAVMDIGCYAINMARFLAGSEPEVLSAHARSSSPGVDRWMRAELAFPGDVAGRITCSLFSAQLLKLQALVEGDAGRLEVRNPLAPQFYNRLRVRNSSGVRSEHVGGEPSYTGQLRAFARWVQEGVPMPTDAMDAVANMRVIDAVYAAAGLPRRGDRAR
jgi:predicted dehydrogenase